MKKLVLIVLCITALLLQSFKGDGNKDKIFAKSVFDCVKKNDLAGFKKAFVTAAIFDSLADKAAWKDEQKSRYKSKMTQHALDSLIPENFHDVRSTFSFNWSKTRIDSIQVRTDPMDGLQELSWNVYFSVNKKQYRLTANTILKTSSGAWKIANKLRLYNAHE